MIALIQRVSKASVTVDGTRISAIGKGFLVFLGVTKEDEEAQAEKLAGKVADLRIMDDNQGKMNLSLKDAGGEILVVSQFTLAANLKGGRRPDFFPAMEPVRARQLYETFTALLRSRNIPVQTGRYAARMEVGLVNDGPVTFVIDSRTI